MIVTPLEALEGSFNIRTAPLTACRDEVEPASCRCEAGTQCPCHRRGRQPGVPPCAAVRSVPGCCGAARRDQRPDRRSACSACSACSARLGSVLSFHLRGEGVEGRMVSRAGRGPCVVARVGTAMATQFVIVMPLYLRFYLPCGGLLGLRLLLLAG